MNKEEREPNLETKRKEHNISRQRTKKTNLEKNKQREPNFKTKSKESLKLRQQIIDS